MATSDSSRRCLRDPIDEIEVAARQPGDALNAHHRGERGLAEDLLKRTNTRTLRNWLNSVWGKKTVYNTPYRERAHPQIVPISERAAPQLPARQTKRLVHQRDGHYCRFCKIPVIRREVLSVFHENYPEAVPWGRRDPAQHAAFQLMWAQYDYIVPHSRGGRSDLENIYLTCAACNFGRGHYLLEDFDLLHPSLHPRREGDWTGLESVISGSMDVPTAKSDSTAFI